MQVDYLDPILRETVETSSRTRHTNAVKNMCFHNVPLATNYASAKRLIKTF